MGTRYSLVPIYFWRCDMAYKYFLYSQDQIQEKESVLNTSGKTFVPGTVVVNGVRKQFTQLSNSATMARFIDTKVVAQGELSTFTYTLPRSEKK